MAFSGNKSLLTARSSYPKILFILFVVTWLLLAIDPISRFDWFLDNLPVFIFVPLLVLTYRKFMFSNISYTLIYCFAILHLVGAHYTYAYVPIDWSYFGFERNQYDRIVHFFNGLLLFYPLQELGLKIFRKNATDKKFSYLFPAIAIIAISILYEFVEFGMAMIFSPEAVGSYLGTQGDKYDSAKDVLMSVFGAAIAGIFIAIRKSMMRSY